MSYINIISEKMVDMPYSLVDWFPRSKLYLPRVCQNPNGLYFMKHERRDVMIKNKLFIDSLCKNTNKDVLDIIERYFIKDMYISNWDELIKQDYKWIDLFKKYFPKQLIKKIPCLFEHEQAYEYILNDMSLLFDKDIIPSICSNPACTHFIELLIHHNMMDNNSWLSVCMNYSCVDIIEKHLDFLKESTLKGVFWEYLALNLNPKAIKLIKNNLLEFDYEDAWISLCSNYSKDAIQLLEDNIMKLDSDCMDVLCSNPYAINLIKKFLEDGYIPNIEGLSNNTNYKCKEIIEEYIYLVKENDCWDLLCKNPTMIEIVRKNLYHLDNKSWKKLSGNPKIFEKDYTKYKYNLDLVQFVINIIFE